MISAKTGLGIDERAGGDRPSPAAAHRARPRRRCRRWWSIPGTTAYLGVVTLVRVKNGALEKGQKIRFMGTGAAYQVDRVGVLDAQGGAGRPARARRGRLHHRRRSRRSRTRASATPSPTTASPPPSRCPASGRAQPVVFCGMYPTDADEYEQSARQPRQAPAQRRQLRVRAREQLGPGLRLPLRLPRPAAPGDHPGAAGARVRPRPRHHRALGRLPRASDRRRGAGAAQPGRLSRPDPDRARRGAVDQGHDPGAGRVSGRRSCSSAPRSAASSWS